MAEEKPWFQRVDEQRERGKQTRCPACNGDDAQAPCAFPEGGQPGCLRDKRLGDPSKETS